MIQAVFFDLYGTLVDVQTNEQSLPPYERLAEWLSDRKLRANPQALQKAYLDEVDRLQKKSTDPETEIDIRQVFEKLLTDLGANKPAASLVTDLAWAFRRFTRSRLQPIPGANDLIQRLRKDYRLGIISNAQKLFTDPELEELRLVDPFEAVILSSETGYKKPSTRMFEVGLQALEVAPDEAIFVGDSYQDDVVGAKQVGLRVLHYCPSDTSQTGPVEPDGRIKKISEVTKYLDEWHEPIETPLVDEILDDDE